MSAYSQVANLDVHNSPVSEHSTPGGPRSFTNAAGVDVAGSHKSRSPFTRFTDPRTGPQNGTGADLKGQPSNIKMATPSANPISPVVQSMSTQHSDTGLAGGDSRSKFTAALTRFMSEVTELASLQLQRDSAERAVARKTEEYERSRAIHVNFPSTAEAQKTSKARAQKEFEELDTELNRRREASLTLIEEIADNRTISDIERRSDEQPDVQRKLQAIEKTMADLADKVKDCRSEWAAVKNNRNQIDDHFRSTQKALKSQYDSLRKETTAVQEKLSLYDAGLLKHAEDIQTHRSGQEIRFNDLKTKWDDLFSSMGEFLKFRIETQKAIDTISATEELITQMDRQLRADVGDSRTRLEALESSWKAIASKLDAIEVRTNSFDGIQKAIKTPNWTDEIITRMDEHFSSNIQDNRTRTEALESSWNAIASRLGALEARTSSVNSTRDQVSTGKAEDKLSAALADVQTQMAAIEKDLKAAADRLDILETRSDSAANTEDRQSTRQTELDLSASLAEIQSQTSAIEKELKATTERLDAFEIKAQIVETQQKEHTLVAIETDLSTVKQDLKATSERVEVVEATTNNAHDSVLADMQRKILHTVTMVMENTQEANAQVLGLGLEELKARVENHESIVDSLQAQFVSSISSLKEQYRQHLLVVSTDIEELKGKLEGNLSDPAAVPEITQRLSALESNLVNDIEALKTASITLDYRMNNLSTESLARHILSNMDNHLRGTQTNHAMLDLRLQALEKWSQEGGGMPQSVRKEVDDLVDTSLQRAKDSLSEVTRSAVNTSLHQAKDSLNGMNRSVADHLIKSQMKDWVDCLRVEMDIVLPRTSTMEEDIDALKANSSKLESYLPDLKAAVETLAASYQKLEDDLNTSKARFSKETEKLSKETEKLDTDIDNVSTEVDDVKKDLETSKIAFTDLADSLKAEVVRVAQQRAVAEKRSRESSRESPAGSGSGSGREGKTNGHKKKRKKSVVPTSDEEEDGDHELRG